MLDEIIEACRSKGLKVFALSSNGQFYRLAVRSKSDEPLTLLQLAKDTWATTKRMSKSEQINRLMELHRPNTSTDIRTTVKERQDIHGNIYFEGPLEVHGIKNKQWKKMYNPPKLLKLICRTRNTKDKKVEFETDLDDLPPDVINKLPDDLNESQTEILETNRPEIMDVTETTDIVECDEENIHDPGANDLDRQCDSYNVSAADANSNRFGGVYPDIVLALKRTDNERKKPKWCRLNASTLKQLLIEKPDIVKDKFSKKELITCGLYFKSEIESLTRNKLERLTKLQLVNAFAEMSGHKETVVQRRSPKTLRGLLKDFLSRKIGKEALNAIIAIDVSLHSAVPKWRKKMGYSEMV